MHHEKIWLAIVALALTASPAWSQFTAQPACVIGEIPGPYAVTAGDLNGDGRPDLVVSSWFSVPGEREAYDESKSRVYIYYQRDGFFRAPADRELVVKSPQGLAIGDFDRDGRNDLAVAPHGTLHLFLGSENFDKDHDCPDINGPSGDPRPCRLGTTGLRDFLLGPVWLKWLGGDQFQHGYFHGPLANDNRGSLPADFNQDGDDDVLLLPRDGQTLRVYYGPLVEMLVRQQDLSQSVTLASPLPLASATVGDLNGDGRLDIVSASQFSPNPAERSIFVHHQNSPLHFTEQAEPSVRINGLCGSIAVADLNGDSLDDLAVTEAGSERFLVFLQRPGKPFATSVEGADQVLPVGNNHTYTLGDLNGDGTPDLIHADGRNTVRIFLGATPR